MGRGLSGPDKFALLGISLLLGLLGWSLRANVASFEERTRALEARVLDSEREIHRLDNRLGIVEAKRSR